MLVWTLRETSRRADCAQTDNFAELICYNIGMSLKGSLEFNQRKNNGY